MSKNIIIGLLLVLLCIAVYSNIQKSNSHNQGQNKLLETKANPDDLFQKKQDCQKYTAQITKNVEAQNYTNPQTGFQSYNYLNKVFYSPKLNTCLYVSTERDFEHGKPTFEIPVLVDALTGETLLSGLREVGKPEFFERKEQFDIYLKDYE